MQAAAYIAGRYPNNRILTSIVRGRAAEQLHPKRAFSEVVELPLQGFMYDVLEEFLATTAPFECLTADDLNQVLPVGGRLQSCLSRSRNRGCLIQLTGPSWNDFNLVANNITS